MFLGIAFARIKNAGMIMDRLSMQNAKIGTASPATRVKILRIKPITQQ